MSLLEKLHRLDERVLPRLARGLRRIRQLPRPRALVVVAALLVLAVVVTIAWEADGPTVDADGIGGSIRVGPQDGDSIPAYVQASREELGRLSAAAAAPAGADVCPGHARRSTPVPSVWPACSGRTLT